MQAFQNSLLLDHESTDQLRAAVGAEAVRQANSARDRANTRQKNLVATTASPPSQAEFRKCVVFLDHELPMPPEWLATLRKYDGWRTQEPHKANFFIALNPSQPVNPLISWAAALSGAWVISPGCFVGKSGASIKFKPAVFTRRHIWIVKLSNAIMICIGLCCWRF